MATASGNGILAGAARRGGRRESGGRRRPDPQRRRVTVELVRQRVSAPDDLEWRFTLDPEEREMLLEGLDAVDLTLKHREDIAAFLAATASGGRGSTCSLRTRG